MKKIIFVALFVAASFNGFAQKSKKGGVTKMLQKMTTELSLTADQQEKLKPILEEQMALKKDSKENPDNAYANKAKLKEITKKIKSILTPVQLELQKSTLKKFKEKGKKNKE